MKRPLLIAIGAAALGAAGLLSAPTFLPLAAQAAPAQAAAVQKTTFSIENMTCAMCPVTVTKAMKGVAGVKSVTVDFAAKTATVIYDPATATVAAIAAASSNAGYPARPA
ncbi:heavy metal-associated domain-containing protein [Sphingobium sp. SA2]|uniref:heavy-metal-associated domain-containing protein n=1 Tax=Sphingobium sp. SA2 TaxID=1524832 RepID=UPI0028C0C267|nr:heavy metal-associated domain-containing protein [Sphingobium sp. SA2]MDT7533005.1 heavy metal-associated domain-containing protein [Sphingobium sp. SA2]